MSISITLYAMSVDHENIPSESYPFDSEKDLNLEALPSGIDSCTVFTG